MNKNISNLKIDHLLTFDPITENQRKAHEAWKEDGYHLVLNGSAGTGKTFTALYLALESVLDRSTIWDKIHIIRSVVPTREMGFLPGSAEEKLAPYVAPYINICSELFDFNEAYKILVNQGTIEFHSTSFIRGITFDNAIIIVDEMQNCNYHELDSVITRVGENSRIMFCGDYYQSDFKLKSDKDGLIKFLGILEQLRNFSIIEFTWSDIVRSEFVRDYIMTKEMVERNE
jgi:predicted ribonuclease YlaK